MPASELPRERGAWRCAVTIPTEHRDHAALLRTVREPLEIGASYAETVGLRIHARDCKKALAALDALLTSPVAGELAGESATAPTGEQDCIACRDGECPLHLGTPSHLGAAKQALCPCGDSGMRDPRCPLPEHRAEAADQNPSSVGADEGR